MKHAVSQ